jgi:glycosyltransferase involved in cell wall biosynthesis
MVFGSVGRLDAVKGQIHLVEALGVLLKRNPTLARRVRLALIGDGPLRSAIERRVRALGLGDRVWMPGSRNDVPELMRGIDLFVLPSLAEGISNTVLEAMACGLPVVATAVGGNTELVEAERSGLLVPPGDSGRLAQAMERFALDTELRRRAGERARARAERLFSLDTMVEGYLAVYDRLCETRTA